jgi:hypothetical protein
MTLKTRGELLVYTLAFALRGIKAKGRAGTITEEDRYAIAERVVAKLREHGDPWRLDEEVPLFFHGKSVHGYR